MFVKKERSLQNEKDLSAATAQPFLAKKFMGLPSINLLLELSTWANHIKKWLNSEITLCLSVPPRYVDVMCF